MTESPWPVVPTNVVSEVHARWPTLEPGWSERAPAELRLLCERYGAIPQRVMPARYGFVVSAMASDAELIFRGSPDPHGSVQAKVSMALSDLSVGPTVHDVIATEVSTWIVMDRVQPGTSLASLDPTTVSWDAVTAPLEAMLHHASPGTNIPRVDDWLRERLTSDKLSDLPPGGETASSDLRDAALRALDQLVASGTGDGLCHGDLSGYNILAAGNDRYMYIDPRGVCGESAYDAATLALKNSSYIPTAISAAYLARRLGVDRERIEAWILVADAARI